MWTGTQFSGTVPAGATRRWFTFNWPVAWHVVWYVMPTTPNTGAPQVDWEVAVERATSTHCAYWITVRNLTSGAVNFDGRYAVLS